MSELHVIAEAGTNHNASLELARVLVSTGLNSGADSVKFQIIYPKGLYVPGFPSEDGYRPNPAIENRRRGMLSDEAYAAVWEYGKEIGIPVTASVFDVRGIRMLEHLGVPYIKLASCDLNNDALIRSAAETGIQLVLATGMSSLREVEHAVSLVRDAGGNPPVLLHCVSIYPTPVERANVRFVSTLLREFGGPVGFSDHTETDTAAILALGLGATWFEKHFTTDRTLEGYDHPYAMEPPALTRYVRSLRDAETALVTPDEKISDAEATVAAVARRSIYAGRDLPAGHVLSERDLLVVRPAGPLTPGDLPALLGRPLLHPVGRHAPLEWNHVTDSR